MITFKSPLTLLLAVLLSASMTLIGCGDDSSSDDGDAGDHSGHTGDGDGDGAGDGDGDGDGDGAPIECDMTDCEGQSIEFAGNMLPVGACCISADECGIDASALMMGCLPLSTLDQFSMGDAGM